MRSRLPGDDAMVRGASRRVAAYVAGLVGVALLLLLALVTVVVLHQQQTATDDDLRRTAATADDVGDPPADSWLVLVENGQVRSTLGLPPFLNEHLAMLRRLPTRRDAYVTVSADDLSFRVVTVRRKREVVQVVADLRRQRAERNRLLAVTGTAAAASLVVAAGLGLIVGRRAVRPLAEALGLQRSFVADASHELRTPLTLLSTRVQVLERDLRRAGLLEAVGADVAGVTADVHRLADVVDDLLVAADPSADDVHQDVELTALVRDVVASATAHARERSVSLGHDLPEDATVVRGAPAALRRAVVSLVDNAVDHAPPGGEVRVALRRERGSAVVAVSDTGPGLTEEQARQALRRFHSGGQRAGRAHYGLGLALTHDVVNRHGGQLRLAPSEQGATFEIVLPAE